MVLEVWNLCQRGHLVLPPVEDKDSHEKRPGRVSSGLVTWPYGTVTVDSLLQLRPTSVRFRYLLSILPLIELIMYQGRKSLDLIYWSICIIHDVVFIHYSGLDSKKKLGHSDGDSLSSLPLSTVLSMSGEDLLQESSNRQRGSVW